MDTSFSEIAKQGLGWAQARIHMTEPTAANGILEMEIA